MPFTEQGAIDEESLRHEVEWAIGAGVHGLGLALASELPRLTLQERSLVTTAVVEQAGGRVPVVVHASAESAELACELARRAEAEGAGALMVHPPTFQVFGLDGTLEFYRRLAAATSLPIFLQDHLTARLETGVIVQLEREFPDRFVLKAEVPPTQVAVMRARRDTDGRMPVFGGSGGTAFYSELIRGAAGTMPGCAVPELFVAVWELFAAGDQDGARRAFARVVPYLTATGAPTLNVAFYRETLALRGIFKSAARRVPAPELTDVDRRELRDLLLDLEIDLDGR
jgi:dihydrodipicolinate synthase/N-acetylneuraminate lyase